MKKQTIILLWFFLLASISLVILFVVIGIRILNENTILMWNANKIEVSAESPLSIEKIKIEFGISVNTINRTNDLDLFENRGKYTVIFDGNQKDEIINEYGENDFLITYDNNYYFSFRHFKTRNRCQHNYYFNFEERKDTIIVKVNIEGVNALNFERPMLKISDAVHYRCNTPMDSVGTIYNMIDMYEE